MASGRVLRSMIATAVISSGLLVVTAVPAFALSETADATWMTSGKVYASAQVGTTLYIGGIFTKVKEFPNGGGGSYEVNNLAAIDLVTGAGIASFNPDVTNSLGTASVRSLALSPDGTILYVGGNFDAVDGQPRANIAAIDLATGQPTGYAPQVAQSSGVLAQVNAILTTTARVYFGGKFSTVNGSNRAKLAATAPDGTLDAVWKPKTNNLVTSLAFAPDGQSIYVGGKFTTVTVNSTVFSRPLVARVTADTGDVLVFQLCVPCDSQLTSNRVHAVLATSTHVYLGIGAKGPNWVGGYDTGTGARLWKFNTVGNVQALALTADGSRLFFGGHFGTARLQQSVCGGTKFLHGLAIISNPATTHTLDCSWVPSIEPFGSNFQGVWTLSLNGTHVWIGGGFKKIGGIDHQNLARFTL